MVLYNGLNKTRLKDARSLGRCTLLFGDKMATVKQTALSLPQEFVAQSVGFSFDVGKNLFNLYLLTAISCFISLFSSMGVLGFFMIFKYFGL